MRSPVIGFGNSSMFKYPIGGGHWTVRLHYLRWMQAAGIRFHWFELFRRTKDRKKNERLRNQFLKRIHRLGLSQSVFVAEYNHAVATPDVQDLQCCNRPTKDMHRALSEVELLLNFCCAVRRPLLDCFPRTALLDLDPGHLQVAALSVPLDVEQHDAHFTVGQNINGCDCEVPRLGQVWQPFLPPLFLSDWPAADGPPDRTAAFSSMTQWTWEELWWGDRVLSVSKRDAYLRHLDLPRRVSVPMELAVNLSPYDRTGDREMLRNNGWQLVHPHRIARTPAAYRRYIETRRGEFGCGKPIHRELRTGWFSDRTGAFLAAGRPVVFEDNGLAGHLPVGKGMVTFHGPEDAADAIERGQADYDAHSEAGRAFAERHLDADRILPRMLDVGLGKTPAAAACKDAQNGG